MTRTVGAFSICTTTGTVTGPAAYMLARGNDRITRIEAGEDTVFNAGLRYSPDTFTAILVSLQTDFSSWRGMQQITACGNENLPEANLPGCYGYDGTIPCRNFECLTYDACVAQRTEGE